MKGIKKRIKRNYPLLSGISIGLLSMFLPVIIFFLIPIIIFLFCQKKSFEKITLLILGFTIIYVPFAFNKEIQPQDQALELYNILKNNVMDTNLGEIRVADEGKVIDNFEEEKNYTLNIKMDKSEFKYNSQLAFEGKRSLEVQIKIPIRSEITIGINITPQDWKDYDYFNMWVKNEKAHEGWLGVRLIDEQNEKWHYDNKEILKQEKWTLLKVPLASLKNYKKVSPGNGRMDKIIGYEITFAKFETENPSIHKIFIDKIYLSKI